MGCVNSKVIQHILKLYHDAWWEDGHLARPHMRKIQNISDNLRHLERGITSPANYELISLAKNGMPNTSLGNSVTDILHQWYSESKEVKRMTRLVYSTIPDVIEDAFNSVKPNSKYPLRDIATYLLDMHKSGKLDMDKIVQAWHSDYSERMIRGHEDAPSLDEFKEDLKQYGSYPNTLYVNGRLNLQSIATFIYLLRSSKLHKKTVMYSGYDFKDSDHVPNVGDVFDCMTPLCTSLSPRVATTFHERGESPYNIVGGPYDADGNISHDNAALAMKRMQTSANTNSYILVFKMKRGDSAMASSYVATLGLMTYAYADELEYTTPPMKYKVVKVDKQHKYIELEPVRSGDTV